MKFFPQKRSDSTPVRRRSADGSTIADRRPVDQNAQVFRRNRTITGSTSSRVQGVHESASQLKSPRVHVHELSHKRRKLGTLLGGVLVVSSVLLFAVLTFTATVHVSLANIPTAVATTAYEETISSYYTYRPIERFRVFLNREQLLAYVAQKHPEVERIAVEGGAGLGGSLFSIEARRPLASWTIDRTKYYVDARGVSFTRNYYSEPDIRVNDQSGVPVQAGASIASNRFLGYVGQSIGLLEDEGMSVSEVRIPFGTTRQIEVLLKGREYPVKLSIDRPVGEQVFDVARAVQHIDKNDIAPEYVDVRVAGKAFYL